MFLWWSRKLLQRCRTKGPRCLLHSKLLWDLLSLFPCWKCSCMSETKGFAFIAPYRQACRNRNYLKCALPLCLLDLFRSLWTDFFCFNTILHLRSSKAFLMLHDSKIWNQCIWHISICHLTSSCSPCQKFKTAEVFMCATARSNAQWSLATLAEMARKSSPLHRIDLRQRFQWNCCVLSGEIKIAGHQQGRMYICNYMYTCIIYNYI